MSCSQDHKAVSFTTLTNGTQQLSKILKDYKHGNNLKSCLQDANKLLIELLYSDPLNIKHINSLLHIVLYHKSKTQVSDLWLLFYNKLSHINEATYTLFIKRLSQLNQLDTCLNLLKLMLNSNVCLPHYRTYIHILNCFLLHINNSKYESNLIDRFNKIFDLCLTQTFDNIDIELYEISLSLISHITDQELFLPYFDKYLKSLSDIGLYPISDKLINILINSNMFKIKEALIIQNLNKKLLCSNCHYELIPYDTSKILTQYIINLKLKISKSYQHNILHKFKTFIEHNIYDIVIDAGNVAFYKNRNIPQVSNVCKVYKYLVHLGFKPLIIISKARIQQSNCSELTTLQKWVSPRGIDDDLYWLYAVLHKPGSKIFTNDEIKNHHLEQYLDITTKLKLKDNCWLRYDMSKYGDNIKLLDSITCDKRLHYNSESYIIHIPKTNNQCLCLNLV